MNKYKVAIKALEAVIRDRRDSEGDADAGLCWVINDSGHKNGVPFIYLYEYFTGWEEYSGCLQYPVPAPEGSGLSPSNAYHDAACSETMFSGEYGEARIRLAKYLIERFKEELEK